MKKTTIDLNADLGEGCDDAAIMASISSANIACGGHTGDAASMREALLLAGEHSVAAGAHPSYPDRDGFGRRPCEIDAGALKSSLTRQVETLLSIAEDVGVQITHVKPHGALYNDAQRDMARAMVVAKIVKDLLPDGRLVGPPTGAPMKCAAQLGLHYLTEGFADRRYLEDGALAPRSMPDAVIIDEAEQVKQVLQIVREGKVLSSSGRSIELGVDTICLHGDTPAAARSAQVIRRALEEAGVTIAAAAT
ncbi:MAG: 5-oxoprolinase subunit PxpA [Pseudomonadota bacterium]